MDLLTLLLLVLHFIANFSSGDTNSSKIPVEIDEDEHVYQAYLDLDKFLKMFARSGVKMAYPLLMEANAYVSLTPTCRKDIFYLISEVNKLKLSALSMLDATGKIPDGILVGSMHTIGDYNQCLKTSIAKKDGSIAFQGRYCLLHLRPPLPKKKGRQELNTSFQKLAERTSNTSEPIRFLVSVSRMFYEVALKWGLCVPSGCSIEDIQEVANYIAPKVYLNASVEYCDMDEGIPFPTSRIIAICAFSVVGLLFIIGTALDYYAKEKGVKFQAVIIKVLLCFSVLKNFPKLVDTKIAEQSLSCLYGLKIFCLLHVILLHHYFIKARTLLEDHALQYFPIISSLHFQIISNGFLVVDIFFFMGGLLNVYARMKAREVKDANNRFLLIIHRLWRIYPAYIFSLLAFYLFQDARGPMNSLLVSLFGQKCEINWWQNLIFIDNFFVQEDTCMIHSWYVAVDMHLFLLSLFTIPLLFRNPKKGILLNTSMIFVGLSSTALWAWHKKIMPGIVLHNWDMDEIYRVWNAYTTTLPHIAPYFSGIMTGFILYSVKDLKISKVYLFIGWPVAGVALLSMLLMTVRWNSGAEFAVVESAMYFTFSRFIYVLAVAWMVVCCARGYGGIINYVLSFRMWVPLARISYMMYLVSPTIQNFYFSNIWEVPDGRHMVQFWRIVSEVAISGLLGFAMVLTIESPLISMEKLLLQGKFPTESKADDHTSETHNCTVTEDRKFINLELQMNQKFS